MAMGVATTMLTVKFLHEIYRICKTYRIYEHIRHIRDIQDIGYIGDIRDTSEICIYITGTVPPRDRLPSSSQRCPLSMTTSEG